MPGRTFVPGGINILLSLNKINVVNTTNDDRKTGIDIVRNLMTIGVRNYYNETKAIETLTEKPVKGKWYQSAFWFSRRGYIPLDIGLAFVKEKEVIKY